MLLTDTDGLYTADPRLDPAARARRGGHRLRALDELEIGHALSPLGSGGMRSKVVAAEMATAAGIPTVIASGLEPGALARAWAGERVGTRFAPQAVRHSSFKLWLKYAKPAHGTRDGRRGRRARAARGRDAACCPSGSSTSRATSTPATRSRCARPAPSAIGKGICNYSADELRRVMGMKSAQVRELLPRATDEAVHRDYFVLA